MRRLVPPAALLLAATLTLLVPAQVAGQPAPAPVAGPAPAAPALRVEVLARGLTIPWDVQVAPRDGYLVSTRPGRLLLKRHDNPVPQPVALPAGTVWSSGETGLMGLAVDPGYAVAGSAGNARVYTCHGHTRADGRHDVRVVAWRLSADRTRATPVRTLVSGIPATSGRHGGCRLVIDRAGSLLVGTGDAAIGTAPRNLDSLGGKVLRVNRWTGRPWRGNPWAGSSRPRRLVFNYGHRNVQGLARRGDGTVWSVEHGTGRDDEINLVRKGGDFGWHPVPGYNEAVPMTDHRLPGTQVGARWSSGPTTVATSGAAFVAGTSWGDLQGRMAVACLKAQKMMFLRFDAESRYVDTIEPPEMTAYGRLRSVTQAPSGKLLVTTSNGTDDKLLLVSPAVPDVPGQNS